MTATWHGQPMGVKCGSLCYLRNRATRSRSVRRFSWNLSNSSCVFFRQIYVDSWETLSKNSLEICSRLTFVGSNRTWNTFDGWKLPASDWKWNTSWDIHSVKGPIKSSQTLMIGNEASDVLSCWWSRVQHVLGQTWNGFKRLVYKIFGWPFMLAS